MNRKSLFEHVESVYSFSPSNDYYDLNNISFQSSKKLLKLSNSLRYQETKGRLIKSFRGFSFSNDYEHQDFINNQLNKFFVVGQKGNYYLKQCFNEIKEHAVRKTKEDIILKIKTYYQEINEIIKNKKEPVSGSLDSKLIDGIDQLELEALVNIEMFLAAVGHNIGGQWKEKKYSSILSFSYGYNSKSTAKKFALGMGRQNRFDKGIIIYSYLPIEETNYIKFTKKLNQELLKLGVSWYEDIHHEAMVLNGILPHHIIGLFEVNRNSKLEKFYLNPWLNKMFLENKGVDFQKGIIINQEHFDEYAKALKYSVYFLQINNKRYERDFNQKYYTQSYGFLN